jgi:hypothetical protein
MIEKLVFVKLIIEHLLIIKNFLMMIWIIKYKLHIVF